MRRHRGIFDTFPDTVDLNEGPNSNNRGGIDEPDECNTGLSPTERRLLSDDLSGELNFSHANASDHRNSRSFRSWDVGESSSRANLQDPFDTHDSRFKEQEIDPSNGQPRDGFGFGGGHRVPMDVDLNLGYAGGNSSNDGGHRNSEMEASSSANGTEFGADSSFGNWGLSCKRKAFEGTSGSSSCFPEAEDIAWHTLPNPNNGSSGLSSSSSMLDSREQINSITGNPGRSSGGSSSRRFLHNEFLDQTPRRPISTSSDLTHPLNRHPPRNLLPFPWGSDRDDVNPRNGSSSSSGFFHESGSRSNDQRRNSVQDSANAASGSNAVWAPRFDSATQNQRRLTEFSPWTLFPASEAESVGRRGRFSPFPLGSSSSSSSSSGSADNVLPSGVNSHGRRHRPFLRPAPLMEVPSDEWRAFTADIEGRHRLVSEMRQILNALQRGENLRAEDYVVFDPFINGVAELHDRHRDMRLDVDNMSYEELLALEERIGDVKTGLNEEVILKSMKQRKHILTSNLEPCCICREEYERGDDIGSLECGHEFHTNCIKQWVEHKNVCPICKTTAFSI